MPSVRLWMTGAAVAAVLPAPVLAEPAHPAAAFTDSVGINLHLEYTNTYYYTKQSTVETLLRDLRVRHVRTRLLAANPAEVPAQGTDSNATNAAALLSRAGVRTVLTGATTINKLYQDTVDRREVTATDGWTANFDTTFANADSAQAWWDLHAPGITRIESVEGVNEPNLKRGAVCANWLSKAADFQQRMNQRVASLPRLQNVLRVAPSLVHSSGDLCTDTASRDPFRALGRHVAPTGAGFTAAWNAGWTAPSASQPVSSWFTATPGSLAATVDIANLHVYPLVKETPEASLRSAFWVSGGVNRCDGPASPNDPGPGATGFSCAEHAARQRADGQRKPVYMTEAGYQVRADGVTERTRGIYLPRLLLANYAAGIKRTYLYELMQSRANSLQADRFWLAPWGGAQATSYGYHAVRRLLWAIGDGSLPSAPQSPVPVDLTVTELGQPGVPANPAFPVRQVLFAEKDGSWSLALWPTDSVASGTAEITPPERRVRISVGGAARRFSLHPIDPQSTVDVQAGQLLAASANQVDVVLAGGHAVVVKLK